MCKCETCENKRCEYIEEPDGTHSEDMTCEEWCEEPKCLFCGERYENGYDGVCYECAKGEYTDELGIQFVTDMKCEPDLCEAFYEVRKGANGAVDILLGRFFTDVRASRSLGIESKTRKALKEFCFEDIDAWIGFLYEVSK